MSYFKLTKPAKGTKAHADAAQRAFAQVRGAIESRAASEAEQAELVRTCPIDEAATIAAAKILGRRSAAASGPAVDRFVWDTLGMAGFARMVLGRLTLDDLRKLAPQAEQHAHGAEYTLHMQVARAGGEGERAEDAVRELRRQMGDTEREHGESRRDRETRDAQGRSIRHDGVGEQFPMLALPSRMDCMGAARDFAEKLAARDVTRNAHDDQGSTILGAALPMWMAGAYLTPLAEVTPAPAKLAVQILVDVSSSTAALNGPLWQAVGALWHAVVECGHSAAIDLWASGMVCGEQPLRPWGSAPRWEYPDPNRLIGATELANSATPAMGRLQASAPHGLRQVAIVVTDGMTDPKDRADFLRLADTPCVYYAVRPNHHAEAQHLPTEGEGWAAIVDAKAGDAVHAMTGEKMLEVLLGA